LIYSRARHDFRYCTCGKCAVDGGRDYTKVVGDGSILEINILASEKVLYNDWNKQINKFGLIKTN